MKDSKLIKNLTYVFWVPLAAVMVLEMVNSLLRTTYFDLYQYVEIARYRWDNPLWSILGAGIVFITVFRLADRWQDDRRVAAAALGWASAVSLFCVLLFRCVAKCDSGSLSEIAVEFLQNNYNSFKAGEYLYMYPFQLGFIAFMEWIYRLFGVENYIVFELVNIVCVVDIVRILGKITEELFEERKVFRMEMMLSMGMLPLFMLATFIYGDIPGWCMGVHVIFHVIRYLRTDRWQELLKASLWLSVGILFKNNLNILLVAVVIILLLRAWERKKAGVLLWILEMIVVSQVGIFAVNGFYEARIGEPLPDGIPKIAWVAMSFQEPYEDGAACGWYNGYNWTVYVENNFDREVTGKACRDDLRDSFWQFQRNPGYGMHYLYEKFTSQWNEPSFMSLLTNEWYSRNEQPQSVPAVWFLYGKGRNFLLFFMNIYHFLIFGGAAIGSIRLWKEWRLERAFLILCIFGGLLFHMLWEAKARYVLFYFLLLLPLAAFGCNAMICRIRNRSAG